jgi:hypothetical protein
LSRRCISQVLSTLHDASDRRVFDSIVVITDRRILDRQLQTTMLQFEQTLGVVENIDTTSRQLKDALEFGKTIIVTTLQKFPVIAKEIGELLGKRFAVVVDEAHSRAYDATGLPLAFDNQSTFKERIYRDKADPKILHDEITVIDHALTRPWTVDKSMCSNQIRVPTGTRHIVPRTQR